MTIVSCEIIRRQTTYWDFLTDKEKLERIHFHGKEEFAFAEGRVPSFTILENHPLLIDYSFGWESIYVTTPTESFEQVTLDLQQAIKEIVGDWRPVEHYLNQFGPDRIVREGYGQLILAPLPLTDRCREVLRAARQDFTSLKGQPPRWPRQVVPH
jgi:hypothetical protein